MDSLIQAIAAVDLLFGSTATAQYPVVLGSGDYESCYCDHAIAAIHQVADLNRVSDRTRDYLLDDTYDLRRLQDRREER